MSRASRRGGRCVFQPELLEVRRCLAVTVAVDYGDLVVTGDADGAVQIVATADEGVFDIFDNGALVEQVSGVDDDIEVDIDQDGAAGNSLTIDLGTQTSIDNVKVDLGDGDNTFVFEQGTIDGRLLYLGGDGADNVTVAAGAEIDESFFARLGDGDDVLLVEGTVGRSLLVRGGDGDDNAEIAAAAIIDGTAHISMGDGINQTTVGGQIDGALFVRGGDDADTVQLLSTAVVERSTIAWLGDGDNELIDEAMIEDNLYYHGGDGNDDVQLGAAATVGGNVKVKLGEGENTFNHDGAIDGNLAVTSKNEADTFTVAETALVGGETNLAPGEQEDGSRRFGRGRRFGFFGFRARGRFGF